jgi:hypothetical protein
MFTGVMFTGVMFTGRLIFTGKSVFTRRLVFSWERGRCFNRDYAVLIGREGDDVVERGCLGWIPGSCCRGLKSLPE